MRILTIDIKIPECALKIPFHYVVNRRIYMQGGQSLIHKLFRAFLCCLGTKIIFFTFYKQDIIMLKILNHKSHKEGNELKEMFRWDTIAKNESKWSKSSYCFSNFSLSVMSVTTELRIALQKLMSYQSFSVLCPYYNLGNDRNVRKSL